MPQECHSPKELSLKQFRERGKRIEGSRLVRDFCCFCLEPMRVDAIDNKVLPVCLSCRPHIPPAHAGLVARQKHGCMKTDA